MAFCSKFLITLLAAPALMATVNADSSECDAVLPFIKDLPGSGPCFAACPALCPVINGAVVHPDPAELECFLSGHLDTLRCMFHDGSAEDACPLFIKNGNEFLASSGNTGRFPETEAGLASIRCSNNTAKDTNTEEETSNGATSVQVGAGIGAALFSTLTMMEL